MTSTHSMENEIESIGPSMPILSQRQISGTKRKFRDEMTYLDTLPSARMYEKSYMHKDLVSHVLVTKTGFIITASIDGYLKFWKKIEQGIEFVKTYRAYLGAFNSIVESHDGKWIATSSIVDKTIKIFDVVNFDMVNLINLEHNPKLNNFQIACMTWASDRTSSTNWLLISDTISSSIIQLDAHRNFQDDSHVNIFHIGRHSITYMSFASLGKFIISIDTTGLIDYWNIDKDHSIPSLEQHVEFNMKIDTDLFILVKKKDIPVSFSTSQDGKYFSILSNTGQIYVFKISSGKLIRQYDESKSNIVTLHQIGNDSLSDAEFKKKIEIEQEICSSSMQPTILFDESSNFLLFPTMYGIKIINLITNKVSCIIGEHENERFIHIALYQGLWKKSGEITIEMLASENPALKRMMITDPTIFCTAWKKNRFYLITKREPDISSDSILANRDVLNEKPTKDDLVNSTNISKSHKISKIASFKKAIIHTDQGDISLDLFPEIAPKTVENFATLSQKGYYNNVTFHRVVKGFVIQTGDPTGTGAGGESIWGNDFEDEINPTMYHDKPYTLSMANSGPNTNGSQFFITVASCPWLDGKHTIFGRCTSGIDTVHKIENTKVDQQSRPYDDIKIINIDILE